MGRAIELHNAALRGLLEEHCGHEVRTDGDSFTLAFHDGVDAVEWCLQVGGRGHDLGQVYADVCAEAQLPGGA